MNYVSLNRVPELRFVGFSGNWKLSKLGDLGDVFTGNTPSTSDPLNWSNSLNGHVWVTPTDITSLVIENSVRHLSDKGWTKARTVPENSVLITSIASIGKNTINKIPVAFNQQINAIVPNDNNSYFVLSRMLRDKLRFASIAGKTATAIINKSAFKNFEVAVTDLAEQEKIGTFFEQLDKLITLQQRKLDLLKKQKQGYLQKMFPKAGERVPELRFAGFSDDWEKDKLGNLSKIYDGTHQTPNYTDHGVMFLSVENIKSLKSRKYISEKDFEKEFKIYPEYGDILMTRIGDVGTFNVVNIHSKIAYYVSLALIKTESLDSYFLNNILKSNIIQREIWKRTLHIAFPKKINKNEIGLISLSFPKLKEQKKIGSFFKKIDENINLQAKKVNSLKELKKGYLQKMFV